MKHLTLLALGVALTGCIAYPRTLPSDSYLVDTKLGQMCHVTKCYYLDLIGRSHNEVDIAKAYGLPANKVYSWSVDEFASLMISPPNAVYSATKLSEHEFQIPKNKATDAAFYALEEEYIELSIGGSGSNGSGS